MSKINHIRLYLTGMVLWGCFCVVERLAFWKPWLSPPFWTLPFIGYYAYHPEDLAWHKKMPVCEPSDIDDAPF